MVRAKAASFAALTIVAASIVPSVIAGEPRDEVVVDRVVAVVDHMPITLYELDQKTAAATGGYENKTVAERLDAELAAKREVLSQLIDERMVTLVAAEQRLTVTEADIDAGVASVISAQGLTPETLDDRLRTAGYTRETYRAYLHDELLRQRLVLLKVRPKVSSKGLSEEAYGAALDAGLHTFLVEERAKHYVEVRL